MKLSYRIALLTISTLALATGAVVGIQWRVSGRPHVVSRHGTEIVAFGSGISLPFVLVSLTGVRSRGKTKRQ